MRFLRGCGPGESWIAIDRTSIDAWSKVSLTRRLRARGPGLITQCVDLSVGNYSPSTPAILPGDQGVTANVSITRSGTPTSASETTTISTTAVNAPSDGTAATVMYLALVPSQSVNIWVRPV